MTSVLERMERDLLLDGDYILKVVGRAGSMYRRVELGSGRVVWQPAAELALLQYWIVDWIARFDSSKLMFATAYERGCSVVGNAQRHVGARHLLAMDIRRFFPSITGEMVLGCINRLVGGAIELSSEDLNLLCKATTFRGGLVMGSPAAPFLANRVMEPVDERIADEIAKPLGLSYSRYSDDLFFSSRSRIGDEVCEAVSELLFEYGFSLNDAKTRFLGPGSNRCIAGVCVGEGGISLGQRRKRELKRRLYRFAMCGDPTDAEAREVLGFVAFCKSIEPGYVGNMLAKYSSYGGDVLLRAREALGPD